MNKFHILRYELAGDGPPSHQFAVHQVFIERTKGKNDKVTVTRINNVFYGASMDDANGKLEDFIVAEAQKTSNRAIGVEKAQATKALKSASGVSYGDGGANA